MEPSTGSTKVFIGHLPMDCTTTDIEAIMGTLEWPEEVVRRCDIRLVRDRETDKFKGFCYVDVGSEERAQQLVGLNGADFGGRRLKIDLATPKVDSRRGGRGGRGGFAGGRGGEGGRGGFRGGRGGEGSVRGGGEGGRGGGRGGHRDRRNSDRRPRTSEGEPNNNNGNTDEIQSQPSKPAGRPRLQLKPRTTDPAELEAKKQREAEEEEARKARLFKA